RLAPPYVLAGRLDWAESVFRQDLEGTTRRFGAEALPTADALGRLGRYLLGVMSCADAEPQLRKCMAIYQQKRPELGTTFNTQSQLGGSLFGQKKFADAEP